MSVVRDNLMERKYYTPYCGSVECDHGMPRTAWDGKQFKCRCGWRSSFEPEFIDAYKRKWHQPALTKDADNER